MLHAALAPEENLGLPSAVDFLLDAKQPLNGAPLLLAKAVATERLHSLATLEQ